MSVRPLVPVWRAAAEDRHDKGRVLLVDDETALLEVWGEILTAAGWTVETASNGARALEILLRGSFDTIMPGCSATLFGIFEMRCGPSCTLR